MSFLDIEPTFHKDMKQLSPEWFNIHLGRLTASDMGVIVTGTGKPSSSEAVKKLAVKICMERSANSTDEEGFKGNYWTNRGLCLEEEARNAFAFDHGSDVSEMGFISRGIFGCSPDGLIEGTPMEDLEIKCLSQKEHGWVKLNGPEKKHIIQIHSRMVIGGFDKAHYYGYHPEHDANQFQYERDEFTGLVEDAMIKFEELVYETAEKLGTEIN